MPGHRLRNVAAFFLVTLSLFPSCLKPRLVQSQSLASKSLGQGTSSKNGSEVPVEIESVRPRIDAPTPDGSIGRATSISIRGSAFDELTTVTIGDQPCAPVQLESGESLACTLAPRSSSGPLNVKVTNRYGRSATLLEGFAFADLFNSPDQLSTSPTMPYKVALADLNRDQLLDLVWINYEAGSLSLALQEGNMTFPNRRDIALASSGVRPSELLVADFNQDQNPDVVLVQRATYSLALFHGDGAGGFAPRIEIPLVGTLDDVSPFYAVLGELDGDKTPELVVHGFLGVYLSLKYRNGTFEQAEKAPCIPRPAGSTAPERPGGLTLSYIDGDDKLDLVCAGPEVGTSERGLYLHSGLGAGRFGPPQKIAIPADAAPELTTYQLVSKDMNADGKSDLFYTNFNGTVAYTLGNGDGTFTPGPAPVAALQNPAFAVTSDFNGDGRPDYAVANSKAAISVFLGSTAGGLLPRLDYSACGATSELNGLATADLNKDGKDDLLITCTGPDRIELLRGN